MSKKKILIVDDDSTLRHFLNEVFLAEGFAVFEASNGEEALSIIKGKPMDVVVMDLRMPGKDGIETLDEFRKGNIESKVIIMTCDGTIRTAVEAMKLGAFDYVVKPFENDEIVESVKKAISGTKLSNNYINESKQYPDKDRPLNIIGTSQAMADIFQVIKKVATPNTTILITGESGTGKTILAQAIHDLSGRKQFPFITVNCAALPENLLESELFGHEKGAFTGAISSRTGKFELAKNGTIFLDEISTLSLTTQAKLLRAIQDKKFEKVGGERTLEIDVRIIAATNERLDKAVAEGYFREDLFYRLNVVTIEMPSLRERIEDIPDLIDFFINKFNPKMRKNINAITREAKDLLIHYAWPGNVRELENVIERAMILEDDLEIGLDSLPNHIRLIKNKNLHGSLTEAGFIGAKLDEAVGKAERDTLIEALEKTHGHRGKAADLLGISRRGLQYKLKKYGLINE